MTTDKTYDAAVIGAGPAGLICATDLHKSGKDVAVFEKDKKVGEPVECAGLFNIGGLSRLGIDKGDYILNEVRGAKFISAGGASAAIEGRESKACVVDRGEFDRFLASKYDGDLLLKTEVKGARRAGGAHELKAGGDSFKVERVVIATGYDQNLHKQFGLGGPSRFISTSQYEIEGIDVDPDFVEVYLGSVAPGFFAWVIPVNENRARVGLGVLNADESTHQYMGGFVKRLREEGRFGQKNKVVSKSGGLIPLFEPNLEVSHDGAYLVGDAAGQVKATTGGGVMLGGLAAKALARAIVREESYEALLLDINKELTNHLLIRKVLNKFGDEQYEHMMEFLNKPDIRKVIEEQGDMDLVGPLLKGIMSNPILALQAMRFLGKGILF